MEQILNFLMWYFIIGTIFTFLVDMINEALKKNSKINYKPPTDEDWGLVERLLTITFWPLGLYIFLSSFFREKDRDK